MRIIKLLKIERHQRLIMPILVLLLMMSCQQPNVYDVYRSIPNTGWHLNDTITFEISGIENENAHDFLIAVRHNNDYLYANMFLYANMLSPNGEKMVDTLHYLMAEPSGRWLGTGVGAIKHHLFSYKTKQPMDKGLYRFSLVHGMRDSVLTGIEDIGFRIEKSQE
jgi:gliding motility-associated lipoprotein GldH